MDICTKVTGVARSKEGILLSTDNADIRIIFLKPNLVRIRVSFDHNTDEASYVLTETAWEDRLDGYMSGERTRLEPVIPEMKEDENTVSLHTSGADITIEKDPLSIRVTDAGGEEVYTSVPGISFMKDSNLRVKNYVRMNEDDCFYGFGEKTGPLDKNQMYVRERGTDSWAYNPEKCNSMYKQIPFYIRLFRETGNAVGVYYNNFFESDFNMGGEKSNYWARFSYYQADGGDIDLFLMLGRSISRILDLYTGLTGRPVMLPKRALGYQGSSMYYSELPSGCDEALTGFVRQVREKGFPIDGFHLSSGYTTYKNKRCVFTWDKERFPDPAGYFEAMNALGAPNVPNVKPGVLLMHPWFDEFESQKVFVRDSKDPSKPAVGDWWGGKGAFWDYTKPEAREIWKKYLTENVIALGNNSVWDDNCEFDSLMDHDARVDYDGKGATIGEFKAVMANIMCKLANDAVKEHDENARPYVVCRAGASGIQQYAQNWVGDNFTSWQSIKHNIPTILGMGLSGQPNEGADIGGFAGPAPEEELFVRWVQNGIFQPRFSIHSASSDNTVTEPWMYHNSTDRIRNAILLRYRMLPYFYSLEYAAHTTGAPIMRPLVYEFQNDPKVYEEGFTFMMGSGMLVANVLHKGETEREVYLPAGSRWYAWEENLKCYEGGQTIKVPVTIDSIPRFIREGAIIPMAKNQMYNLEKEHTTALELIIAPKADCESTFTLYDDDGVSNDYQKGVYRKTEITVSGWESVEVDFTHSGSYESTVESLDINMIRQDKAPFFVQLEDRTLRHYLDREQFDKAEEGWYFSETTRSAEIRFKNPKKDMKLTVSYAEFDLIGM